MANKKSILTNKEILGVKILCGKKAYTVGISGKKTVQRTKVITEKDLKENPKIFMGVKRDFFVSNNIVLDAFVHTAMKP